MKNLVLQGGALSKPFIDRLLQDYGNNTEFLRVEKLAAQNPLKTLMTLLRVKADQLLIPFENESVGAIRPIMFGIAMFLRAGQMYVIDGDHAKNKLSRWQACKTTVGVGVSSFRNVTAALFSAVEMFFLLRTNRIPDEKVESNAILYLKTNFAIGRQIGGSVGHISGVVNDFVRRGFKVFFSASDKSETIDDRVDFIKTSSDGIYGIPLEFNQFSFQTRILQTLRKRFSSGSRVRFIYQRMSLSNYVGVILSRMMKVPLYLEYNGSEVWVARHWGKPLKFEKIAVMAERVCLRHAHRIVTVSQPLVDDLVEKGVAPERIVFYPNCIDPDVYNADRFSGPEKKQIKEALGWGESDVIVTFVGTFGRWHGVDILAHAIAKLCRDDWGFLQKNKVRFLLIGDGKVMPEVREILSSADCQQVTKFLGLVPQLETPGYLAVSDILVSPHNKNPDGSNFFGSPTKLFEYMAMGKSIIASDLDQIGQVLKNSVRDTSAAEENGIAGELSLLVEPGNVGQLSDGIKWLTLNSGAREKLAANASREALAKYTWHHHVQKILDGNKLESHD